MLTVDEYLNHWRESYGDAPVPADELTQQMVRDAETTVDKANMLLQQFGEDREITSGWRPTEVNRLIPGAALRSNHMMCLAIDLADPDGALDDWCLAHPESLGMLGLYQEHPAATKGWCHVQIVPPKSGKRVFYP